MWILEEQFSPQQEGIPNSNSHVFFTFQTIQHQTKEEIMNGSIMECPNCSSWLGKILVKSHVMFNVTKTTFSKAQKEINTRIPIFHFDLWWIKKPSTFSIKIALSKKVLCTCHYLILLEGKIEAASLSESFSICLLNKRFLIIDLLLLHKYRVRNLSWGSTLFF